MKYSLAWLGRYVDLSGVDFAELANRFTLAVAEVEGLESVGEGLEGILVARVEEVAAHPDADKLTVCEVNDGSGTLRTVVCGAPNVKKGMTTALAVPGTQLGDLNVQSATIRGVESHGMLCSEQELGLTDSHDGILVLPSDWEPGTPLHTLIPLVDFLLEVDNKSITHRPDLWGHVGVAREVAGLLERPLLFPDTTITEGEAAGPEVQIDDSSRCPRYCALGLTGIQIEDSPLWLKTLLHRCGTRPINNVVDVTNFVMMELGNPLHAFDAREIMDHPIVVRLASEGENVVTLDDQERVLTSKDLVICSGERPVAVAGVMGLANSEVRDDTTELVLESANFRAESVRRTSIRLGLRTEASSRFEKSLDPANPPIAAKRFANLLMEICPAVKVSTRLSDVCTADLTLPTIETSVSHINSRLGTELAPVLIHRFLRGIDFDVEDLDGDAFRVTVPSFRATKDISIPEDLIEEVGRLYGFDNISPVQPSVEIPSPYRHPDRTLHRRIRTQLSFSFGWTEVQTYSFDSEPFLERIGRSASERVAMRNPISADQTHLRTHLMPGLCQALERSQQSARNLSLYEIGRVFSPSEADGFSQPYRLGLITWRHPGEANSDDTPTSLQHEAYAQLKGTLEPLFERLNVAVVVEKADESLPVWLHPVRSGTVRLSDGRVIGHIGCLHPDVIDGIECGPFAAAMELELDTLLGELGMESLYDPIGRFPSVPFDLSVIVPENITHHQLYERIVAAHPSWVRKADLTGIYRGDPIPDGQKSMTYRITFQSQEETLAMEEVNDVVAKLVKTLENELGGWLRL
ncbi:MAG: phenylalanine--tRNA ligase subunit beta [Myxococcales bacterium]|nr:phenylalanine--tRNA ligase subunit beta [Myxococcales bacterium]